MEILDLVVQEKLFFTADEFLIMINAIDQQIVFKLYCTVRYWRSNVKPLMVGENLACISGKLVSNVNDISRDKTFWRCN